MWLYTDSTEIPAVMHIKFIVCDGPEGHEQQMLYYETPLLPTQPQGQYLHQG